MTSRQASPSQRVAGCLLAIALIAAACSGGDDDAAVATTDTTVAASETTVAPADDTTTSTTAASEPVDGSASGDVCAVVSGDLDLADPGATESILAATPDEFRTSMQALVQVSTALAVSIDGGSTDELVDVLDANPNLAADLERMADLHLTGCDDQASVEEFRTSLGIFALSQGEPSAEYCAALSAQFNDDLFSDEETDDSDEADLASLRAIAVPEHAEAFDRVAALDALDPDNPDVELLTAVGVDIMGLGLFTEARCKTPGAFGAAVFIGAFLSAAASDEGFGDATSDDGASDDGASDDGAMEAEPVVLERVAAGPEADAIIELANGRIDALDWVLLDLNTDDPGIYLVDLLVPVGWEVGGGFSVDVTPPADSDISFFTDITVSASCQGFCAPTDEWAERFASGFDAASVVYDEALTGPEGRLVVLDDSFLLDVTVGRWDATADHFFQCSFELDEADADLEAFASVICQAALPRWLPLPE